jgi:hypothetical protein
MLSNQLFLILIATYWLCHRFERSSVSSNYCSEGAQNDGKASWATPHELSNHLYPFARRYYGNLNLKTQTIGGQLRACLLQKAYTTRLGLTTKTAEFPTI